MDRIKLVVTDACIFIDLYDLELVNLFFELQIEVHTTSAVMFELYAEQQQVLKAYQSVNRLIVHNLLEVDFIEIHAMAYPRALSETDKSVLHIAAKINACVISSDKAVRNCAKNKNIDYHGMLWVLDRLVELKLLTPKQGALKLQELVATNFIYQNNRPLISEINKRLKDWGS